MRLRRHPRSPVSEFFIRSANSGADSLTLAQRGAEVVGLDVTGPAIDAARGLAAELGLTDLEQRSRFCHPGSAASHISIHSGVTPGSVTSSSRASAFVWVTQGITAGASPSSG